LFNLQTKQSSQLQKFMINVKKLLKKMLYFNSKSLDLYLLLKR